MQEYIKSIDICNKLIVIFMEYTHIMASTAMSSQGHQRWILKKKLFCLAGKAKPAMVAKISLVNSS